MNTTKNSPQGQTEKPQSLWEFLYIIGTVSGILSVIVTGSTLDGPSSPAQISANANEIIYGRYWY